MNEDQINALAYALAKIEGTDGGYSPTEVNKHKSTLRELYNTNLKDFLEKEK